MVNRPRAEATTAKVDPLPDWTIIGFSGHRALKDSTTAAAGIRAAVDRVAALRGPLAAVASAASGSDTLFLEDVARRDIPFFLLLPFRRARFQQDFVPADWQRVELLLDEALDVEELGDTDDAAKEAYLETGVRVVDRADVMLAVWDGQPARGVGGTAEVVDYARALGKPLIIVDPATGHVTPERLERLSGRSAMARWDGNARLGVERTFEVLDREAMRHKPKARYYLLYAIVSHLAAAALAVLTFMAPEKLFAIPVRPILIGLEILCLLLALFFFRRRRQPHHAWVHSRIGAELCRSFLAIWHLRRHTRPLVAVGGPAFDQLHRNLCMAWYLDRPEAQDLTDARDRYLQQRVLDQLDYFERNLEKVKPRLKRWKRGAFVATILAILAALVALPYAADVALPCLVPATGRILDLVFLCDVLATQWAYNGSKVLAAILPLVTAAILSWIVSEDYERRKIRYADMADMLTARAQELQNTRTWHSLTRIAVETEEQLLHELLEWHSVTRFAEAH